MDGSLNGVTLPELGSLEPPLCLSHADDHSRFLVLCHRVCLEVHVPEESLHVPTIFSPTHLFVHEWQTDDVHFCMDPGDASLSDAVHSAWPCGPSLLRQHFPLFRKSHY